LVVTILFVDLADLAATTDARTFLYGIISYVNSRRNGTFSVFATARDSSPATSQMAGESQTGVYVEMMHAF
jgi:hypothetical protein